LRCLAEISEGGAATLIVPIDVEWLVAKVGRGFVVALRAKVVAEYVTGVVEDDVT
jgi:hypothetical protein